jgi:hypothetical protein
MPWTMSHPLGGPSFGSTGRLTLTLLNVLKGEGVDNFDIFPEQIYL